MNLVLLTGTHRFYNLLHKNRHMEGSDYFNRACIPAFSIAGMAVYTGVSTVVFFPVLTGSTADVEFEDS